MLITALFVLVLAATLAWLGRIVVLPQETRPKVEVEPRLAADVVNGAAVVWQAGLANAERIDAYIDDMSALRRTGTIAPPRPRPRGTR